MNTKQLIDTHGVRITCTNGNSSNGISGSRVTVWQGEDIADRFEVPKRNGVAYCLLYGNGVYGKRFRAAVERVCEA